MPEYGCMKLVIEPFDPSLGQPCRHAPWQRDGQSKVRELRQESTMRSRCSMASSWAWPPPQAAKGSFPTSFLSKVERFRGWSDLGLGRCRSPASAKGGGGYDARCWYRLLNCLSTINTIQTLPKKIK